MKVRDFYKKLDKAALEQSIAFITSTGAKGILIEKGVGYIKINYPDSDAPIFDYPIKSIRCMDYVTVLVLGPKKNR